MSTRIALGWPLLLLVATPGLLGAGCSPEGRKQTAPADALADKPRLEADARSMAPKLLEREGQPVRLDLSDPAQYRSVMNRLRAAGNTPENSPELFSRLERAKALATGAPTRGLKTARAALELDDEWCGHLLPILKSAGQGSIVVDAKTLASCVGGADYVYADVAVYETTADGTVFQHVGGSSAEEYAGGTFFSSGSANHTFSLASGRQLYVDSYVLAFNDATGESVSTAVGQEVAPALTSEAITLDHPRELIGEELSDNAIRVCLERGAVSGSHLDCDYASGILDPETGDFVLYGRSGGVNPTGVAAVDRTESKNKNRWLASGNYWAAAPSYNMSQLYVPLAGTFSPGSTSNGACTIFSHTYSNASLILKDTGGRCQARNIPPGSTLEVSGFPMMPSPSGSFSTLVSFGPNCLGNQQNVALAVDIAVRADCGKRDSRGNRVLERRHGFLLYEPVIDFKFSCLAEGTGILRADGKSVPVQDVKVGDRVVADDAGLVLTVNTVSRGGESRPLVLLRDASGREVRVTAKHPLVTEDGRVVAAEALTRGDRVRARGGVTTLAAVERVASEGQVYNLTLGTDAELTRLGERQRTFFANGYLVGDSSMQDQLERRRPDKGELLARLPKAWHQDYLNDPARKTAARR
ncbi:hypothetical protein HPC49_05900 [Pyxidicoccus fallax]|uniref:Hint domain-containing protein n=1 Tax=Pyxidicoccus fallax TaxID=394095 RepID=A0A848LEC2_9BACT|nr:Hint domain-containing protein [Pyxidicoccus fallax]NMO15163.1 hypothetical protein [Pyxidicoccus fallax]NPC77785.1 hypothetical protein [Pyxidicoccus fallax]